MYPFEACSTFTVTGCTGAGKTSWIFKLLKNRDTMFTRPVNGILYCYGIHQPLFNTMERELTGLTLHEGVPSHSTLEEFADGTHKVILLDDLVQEVSADKRMEKLFTMGSHHLALSVIYITQNLFPQGRSTRTIALNTHYVILFRSMRSASQISHLGGQLYPRRGRILVQAYENATQERYGYLVVDMSPHTQYNDHRLRTRVLPSEGVTWVYEPRV